LPRVPTVVFAALYLLSAAFIDWYAVIELNSVAGVTIVLALLALASGRTISPLWWLLISAGTLSITVTNWSVGLAATLVRWPPKRFAEISAAALALIVLLSSAQYFLFSNASLFFLPRSVVDETQWTQIAQQRNGGDAWEPLESLRSLLITTVVAPTPYIEIQSGDKVVTNQQTPWSDNIWGGIAASLAWIALLCCGIWGGRGNAQTEANFVWSGDDAAHPNGSSQRIRHCDLSLRTTLSPDTCSDMFVFLVLSSSSRRTGAGYLCVSCRRIQ
jgi:hypothetical protein